MALIEAVKNDFWMRRRLCPGISRLEILRLQANALEAAFMSHTERQEIRRKVEALLVNGPAGLFAKKAIA